PPPLPLFPYTTLFRSRRVGADAASQSEALRIPRPGSTRSQGFRQAGAGLGSDRRAQSPQPVSRVASFGVDAARGPSARAAGVTTDRKSTRLNSSHQII